MTLWNRTKGKDNKEVLDCPDVEVTKSAAIADLKVTIILEFG